MRGVHCGIERTNLTSITYTHTHTHTHKPICSRRYNIHAGTLLGYARNCNINLTDDIDIAIPLTWWRKVRNRFIE